MENHQRHRGYVIGSGKRRDETIFWTVKVKDESDPNHGKKFVVVSVHDQLELAKGLDVNFVIGTMDDQNGQKVLRAVDVIVDGP